MIYVFLANGCEEIEALTPVDVLLRAGQEVKTVSITDTTEVTGTHGIKIVADTVIADVVDTEFDMLVLPGGLPGADYLEASAEVKAMVDRAVAEDKFISAICAAPKVLGKFGVLKGKKATCFPGFEDKLVGAEAICEPVVRDGKVITSRGIGTAMEFSLALTEAMAGKAMAEDLRKKMLVL